MRKTIDDAPKCLNTNDKAMWVTGWNEAVQAIEQAERVEPCGTVKQKPGYPEGHCFVLWTKDIKPGDALYLHPPTAPAQPLTDEQIYEMYSEPCSDAEMVAFARAIEQAHGIKGASHEN